MARTYLLTRNGQITKWIIQTPLLIDEALLQRMFPGLPIDEDERQKFFLDKKNILDQLLKALENFLKIH